MPTLPGPADEADAAAPPVDAPATRRATWWQAMGRVATAVREADEAQIEAAVAQLGQSRRWLAPLSYIAGGFGLLVDGVKLIFLNWRLTLIEILPAVWIWVTFWDLKAHALKGRSFTIVRGPLALLVAAVVVAITVGAYFCNAVFAYAVSGPRPPRIGPATAKTRNHWRLILGWGFAVGLGHAVATIFVARAGVFWFTLALGLVLLVMMTSFVSVPAQIIGSQQVKLPMKDKISAGAASGAMSAVLTSPGFVFNRLGLLLAGTKALQIPGVVLFSIGIALQAAATSGAKAVKLGTRFSGGGDGASAAPAGEALDG